jgi:hypothetical protein
VSQPFTGNIAFNKVKVTAAGMPDSTATTLPAGQHGPSSLSPFTCLPLAVRIAPARPRRPVV